MLGNETLWETAKTCHELLSDAQVPHAIAGGVAVCLHGYQRNTVDLDLVVQAGKSAAVRDVFQANGIVWSDEDHEFRTPAGVVIYFLVAGERAGKGSEVRFSDPADAGVAIELEGLPVLSLAALIESKIASGQGQPAPYAQGFRRCRRADREARARPRFRPPHARIGAKHILPVGSA
jgi:hypothetical protein